jgi:hypothetical protein
VDDFTDVVLSAQLSDITQADRWFALVCETYEALASEDDQSWDEFCGRLTGAAASEGFPTEAEKFTEYLASVTSAPLDVVAAVSDQGQRGLAEMYREAIAAAQEDGAGQPEEDPAAWNAYLAANGPAWDGTEGSWQPYRDWFLYYAVEAGVQGAAENFLEYVDGQQDKIATFAQYGITVGTQSSTDDSAESTETIDSSSFPELSEGDSGEWVDYLDSMLRSRGF